MIHKAKSLSAVSLMLLLLAACGSSDLGGILGGGGSNDTGSNMYEIRGTVESVDLNSRSVYLTNVSGYTSMLSNSGNAVRVYFEDNTPVDYQGQSYRVSDLERGDQVAVRVDESGNRLVAERMTVTYNSGGTSSNTGGMYGSTVRGTVRYVDTSRRTIEVDTGNASRIVSYASNTPVYFGGQTYQVADLERGDEIDVRVGSTSGSTMVAEQITVVRSISSGTSGSGTGVYGSTQNSTIRGTVRYVDTSRRTIELESTSWISGFNSGAGSNMSTMIISYDNNTSVDVAGRLNPVTGLERGDVIEVRVRSLGGNSYAADRIFLVRDVRQ
jgi:hypothetical protein